MLLSQGELPTAPAGPGWDDRVQSGESWRRVRQLQKDPVNQSPTEGDQQQPAGGQLTRVLPPGCRWQPQYLPVITEGRSVQYWPTSRRCIEVCHSLHLSESALLSFCGQFYSFRAWSDSWAAVEQAGMLKMTEGLSSLFPLRGFPPSTPFSLPH